MTVRPVRLVGLVVVVASFLAACGSAAGPTGTGGPPPSSGPASSAVPSSAASASALAPAPSAAPAALILKVTTEGGFINPVASLNALPIVEVYGDGRILTPGPVDAIFPGPLLAPVDVRNVGAQGADAIIAAIRKAGLDRGSTAGPGIPGDSGTDIFRVTLDGQTVETRLSGNGPGVGGVGQPGGGGGGSDDPGRSAAFALLDRLLDPNDTWGAAAGPHAAYLPTGFRVFVAPGAPAEDATTHQEPVAWPLATALGDFGTPALPNRGIDGLRQGAVVGADAEALGPILTKANQATPFTSGGKEWTLYVRALLPDEAAG